MISLKKILNTMLIRKHFYLFICFETEISDTMPLWHAPKVLDI